MKIKYNGAIKASSDGNEDIVMYWDGQKVYEGPADSDMTREIAWFLDDPEKLQEIVDYCNSFGDPVIEDTSDLMDVAATFVEMVGYELREAESIDDDVYVSDEAGHFEIFEKSKEVTGAKKSVKCSTDGNVPYDLVSMLVALRDYADVSDAYVSDEHGKLVDIADSLYNVGEEVVETMKPEFKKVYEKYGKDYFDTVLDDVSALDSQLTRNNVNDLIADYEDRANAFIGVEGACGSKKSVKAAEQDGNCDKSFKMQGTTYCIEMINDGGSYVAKWWDSSDNGLGYNNKGWVALNNDFGRNTGKFNSDNIESLLGIISEFDRKPSKPVQDRIKREVAKLINFDTINSSCGRKSIKSSDDGWTTDELVDKMNNNYRKANTADYRDNDSMVKYLLAHGFEPDNGYNSGQPLIDRYLDKWLWLGFGCTYDTLNRQAHMWWNPKGDLYELPLKYNIDSEADADELLDDIYTWDEYDIDELLMYGLPLIGATEDEHGVFTYEDEGLVAEIDPALGRGSVTDDEGTKDYNNLQDLLEAADIIGLT